MGWYDGTLTRKFPNNADMKAEDGPVWEVKYDDGKRNTQLNPEWYNTDFDSAKPGHWHFVITKERLGHSMACSRYHEGKAC